MLNILLTKDTFDAIKQFNNYEDYALAWAKLYPHKDATGFILLELLEKYIDSIKPTCLDDYLVWLEKEKGLTIDVSNLEMAIITMLWHDIDLYNQQGFLRFRKIDGEVKLLT